MVAPPSTGPAAARTASRARSVSGPVAVMVAGSQAVTPWPAKKRAMRAQPVGVGVQHVHPDRAVGVQVDEAGHGHQAVGGEHVGPGAGARRRLALAHGRDPAALHGDPAPRPLPPGVSTRAPVTSSRAVMPTSGPVSYEAKWSRPDGKVA